MCSYSSYSYIPVGVPVLCMEGACRYRHSYTVGAPTIPLAVPVGISIAHTLHYSREKLAAGRQVREDDAEGAW